MIASEDQAETIGQRETGGRRGEHFTVFTYVHRPSGLTAFGVETATGRVILRN